MISLLYTWNANRNLIYYAFSKFRKYYVDAFFVIDYSRLQEKSLKK